MDKIINNYLNIISINPSMIKSLTGKKIITEIPMDRVLVETDGPLCKISGKKIEPSNLVDVYKKINDIYGISNSNEIVYNNFKRLLRDNLK